MENLKLVNFDEVVSEFLENIEVCLGSEGYDGFIVYTDDLHNGKLNFGWDFSYDDEFVYDGTCIYSYNLEDEDLDEDYIKEQIKDALDNYIENLI